MADLKEAPILPVNSNGAIVLQVDEDGDDVVVGGIPTMLTPIDEATKKMVVKLPNNVRTATLDTDGDVVGISGFDPQRISKGYKFYLPWTRDASGNVQDKSYNGDAGKFGSGSATQTRGYFTSGAAATFATGYRFETPISNSHVDITQNTLVFHATINKAAPAGNEYICGTQNNSSTPGLLLLTGSNGNLTVYYKPFGTQNNFTAVAGIADGTDHSVTVVVDRATVSGPDPQKTYRTGYLYTDGVLQSPLVIDCSGNQGIQGKFVFGGGLQASSNIGVACKFANVHLLSLPFDVADLPVQRMVDELNIRSVPITASLVGY